MNLGIYNNTWHSVGASHTFLEAIFFFFCMFDIHINIKLLVKYIQVDLALLRVFGVERERQLKALLLCVIALNTVPQHLYYPEQLYDL